MNRRSSLFRKALALLAALIVAVPVAAAKMPAGGATATPITHVIVVLGENRSFDHLFGLYKPPPGQTVFNILSEGIVRADGSPGPNYAKAEQYKARVTDAYDPAPTDKALYKTLPPLMTDGAPRRPSDRRGPPFSSMDVADGLDQGLSRADRPLLLRGATGLPHHAIDTRLANVMELPNGPYPITPSIPYDAYMASPVHRFFQMWQQMDCSRKHAGAKNPSGCLDDLFPWVEVSAGSGGNGKPRSDDFDDTSTGEGSVAMGFYNMSAGDAPYLRQLAAHYTLADNYHQAVIGGTGANHIMLGTGDAIWYEGADGKPATPPAVQIENPNPQRGTNNYYRQDGYEGGSYVDCADAKAPGVAPILSYLHSLPSHPKANCEKGRYYLVNNYDPGYLGDGRVNTENAFAVPPSHLRTIGDALLAKRISFRYYGEGWNAYVKDPEDNDTGYCNICDFLQYTASIMTDAALREEHIADLGAFYDDVHKGTLPSVVFIKPSGLNDGHPASSRLDIFEAFTRRLIDAVQAKPGLWAHTAILITFDEAGGYWDSGYIQPLDFFGDGPRVPLLVVSPFAAGGRVVHSYDDHVSILKFIERNWNLVPLTARSRDNLPDPALGANPYVPANRPAIGDLMDMFRFPRR